MQDNCSLESIIPFIKIYAERLDNMLSSEHIKAKIVLTLRFCTPHIVRILSLSGDCGVTACLFPEILPRMRVLRYLPCILRRLNAYKLAEHTTLIRTNQNSEHLYQPPPRSPHVPLPFSHPCACGSENIRYASPIGDTKWS